MFKYFLSFIALFSVGCTHSSQKIGKSSKQSPFISEARPFTLAGKRTGPTHFNRDGSKVIFQSERSPSNPFYQIYYTDLNKNKTLRISNGIGKTRKAWIHPNDKTVLFASTHLDRKSKQLQSAKLKARKTGKAQKYSRDYDKNYDLFETSLRENRRYRRLTKTLGYDAEASYSPDGQWIVFTSNRHAYSNASKNALKRVEANPSQFADIYLMKANGSQVRRLTKEKGYDGHPTFSPDGKKIVWQKFSEKDSSIEVHTMNIDGTERKKLTNHKTMSLTPFYHPSGDYIIYSTNLHGYSNFELYAVRADGQGQPLRVTYEEGFDGSPVFTPDGHELTWTRQRSHGDSQVFIANWNDAEIRNQLSLAKKEMPHKWNPELRISDLKQHIQYLASRSLRGRDTGSKEELEYSTKIAGLFQQWGLAPYNGGYQNSFEYTQGVKYGTNNSLSSQGLAATVHQDWKPLSLSKSGKYKIKEIGFVGYGIVAPASETHKEYNSYKGTQVKNKWVVVFDGLPEDTNNETRRHLFKYASINHKVMMARHHGAKGVIFLQPPTRKSKTPLLGLKGGINKGATSIPAISMTLETFNKFTKNKRFNFSEINKTLDRGKLIPTHTFSKMNINLQIDINPIYKKGLNTLAIMPAKGAKKTLIIGAHGDHLGDQPVRSSLANGNDKETIHFGADDNASGVAAVLELAHYFKNLERKGQLQSQYNLVFAIWSGEEIGSLGSSAFLKTWNKKKWGPISTYINMDMIGRYENSLSIQGIGSSPDWNRLLEAQLADTDLSVQTLKDPYLPTDAMSFYVKNIPIVNFFTGAHEDYHTPRDTEDKINYEGLKKVTALVASLSRTLSSHPPLKYAKVEKTSKSSRSSSGFRIFLGTIPDYNQESVKGVKISGVVKGGPAESAGLQGGDIIVHLDAYKIESIYDYVYSLQAIRPDKPTKITVLRQSKPVKLDITPKLRN